MPSCRSVRAPVKWTTDRSIHDGVEWSLWILWQGRGARRPPGCEHELPKLRGVSFFDNAKHTSSEASPDRSAWGGRSNTLVRTKDPTSWSDIRCSWNFRDFQLIHGPFWMELLAVRFLGYSALFTHKSKLRTSKIDPMGSSGNGPKSNGQGCFDIWVTKRRRQDRHLVLNKHGKWLMGTSSPKTNLRGIQC